MKYHPFRLLPIAVIMFFAVLMVQISAQYMSFKLNVDFLLTKQAIIHIKSWRWSFYFHIITGPFILITGALQFIRPLTLKFPKWHRWAGKVYVGVVVLICGPAGLVMAFYANGGVYARISFVILSCLWILFTYLAYYYIRRRNIKVHTHYMLRSYALTLSAVTFRLYAYFMPYLMWLRGREEYIFLSWASWVPNLLIAEILIYYGYMNKLKPKGLLS